MVLSDLARQESDTPLAKSKQRTARIDETTITLVGRLMRDHIRPHLWRIAFALLCMVVAAGSTAALAKLMEPVLDDVFLQRDES